MNRKKGRTGGITIRDQVIVYFLFSPDEALAVSDIVGKVGSTESTVSFALRNCVRDGIVVREKQEGSNRWLYTAGPWIKAHLATRVKEWK